MPLYGSVASKHVHLPLMVFFGFFIFPSLGCLGSFFVRVSLIRKKMDNQTDHNYKVTNYRGYVITCTSAESDYGISAIMSGRTEY